jgi:hypothetical protein
MRIAERLLQVLLYPLAAFLWFFIWRPHEHATYFNRADCEAYLRTEHGLPRRVVPSGARYQWGVFKSENGDVNVLPLGEEDGHTGSKDCPCQPRVDMEGSRLVILHNAFDHREIVEQAVAIMNGEG